MESKTDINQIKIKVDKLIYLHQQLNEKYRNLQEAHLLLEQTNAKQKNTIDELHSANKKLESALKAAGSGQNTRVVKSKLNEYIREIDRCLAMLNN